MKIQHGNININVFDYPSQKQFIEQCETPVYPNFTVEIRRNVSLGILGLPLQHSFIFYFIKDNKKNYAIVSFDNRKDFEEFNNQEKWINYIKNSIKNGECYVPMTKEDKNGNICISFKKR